MTAPYSPRIAELISGSLRHEATVTAHPAGAASFELESTDLSVTFAEDWSPYAQASVTGLVPADQARLDALDSRQNCRISITAGYTYPDATSEIFPLADLALVSRDVSRPADSMELSAVSDELYTQEYFWQSDFPLLPTTGVNEAISWCLEYSLMTKPRTLSSSFANGYGAADLAGLEIAIGDPMWRMIAEVADRTGVRVYCDETRIWRIVPRPEVSGVPAHSLTIGQDGTLTDTNTSLSRDGWYNGVSVDHQWQDGEANYRIVQGAYVTSGPFAVGTVGYKVHVITSDRPISQLAAYRIASTKLRNLVSRGRSLKLTAIAAYWLRPGMTISVTLPTGEPELHLIQSVTFRPFTGLMDITTRQPVNVQITGE